LKAIDLPELVTTRLGDYEALALELATNPALLKATRDKLWRNRLTTPLYDSERFRKNIEAAYATMLS
jgi:predicted O-linked N-acetylglucosamine transferase (SPINDLY family)